MSLLLLMLPMRRMMIMMVVRGSSSSGAPVPHIEPAVQEMTVMDHDVRLSLRAIVMSATAAAAAAAICCCGNIRTVYDGCTATVWMRHQGSGAPQMPLNVFGS